VDEVERLVAEAEIGRVLARYCRGIDRMDLDLVASCYHPDARDEHGSFAGTVDEYVEWVRDLLDKYDATAHYLANRLTEFSAADVATVETYGMAVHRRASGAAHLNLTTGFRFVDRFERRDGTWRIAHRIAVTDWALQHAPDDWWPLPAHHRTGQRGRGDPVYGVGPSAGDDRGSELRSRGRDPR
jgi:hypothetical protein